MTVGKRPSRPGPASPWAAAIEEVISMCANCGSGTPEDRHGDDRNITWSGIRAAAGANDMSADEAIENRRDMSSQQAASG